MGGDGSVEVLLLLRPQDSVRPAAFSEKPDCDFGIGGTGMSLKAFSFGDFHSSPLGASVDDGAVDAALRREELSVVDAVFVFEAPLPLYTVSSEICIGADPDYNKSFHIPRLRSLNYLPIPMNDALKHIVLSIRRLGSWSWEGSCRSFCQFHTPIKRFTGPIWPLEYFERRFHYWSILHIFKSICGRFSPPETFGEFRHVVLYSKKREECRLISLSSDDACWAVVQRYPKRCIKLAILGVGNSRRG
jgi:hypothetical protein